MQKILVIGPNWIGDMIMSQSLYKLIKQKKPTAEITVMAPAWTQAILALMPEVSRVITTPFKHGELRLVKRWHMARQLRQQHYDQAILLPNSFKSALIPWLAGIKRRVGWLGEYRYGALNDVRHLDKKRLSLMVERFAALALEPDQTLPTSIPWPHLVVDPDTCRTLRQQHGLNDTAPILALCPGAAFGPAKRWPAEHFAQLAQQKLSTGWQVWLFGSPSEQALAQSINDANGQRCHNLVGQLDLAAALHLLSQASVVVANDSGLMHAAAALQRPVVAIYGSTPPEFAPPLSQQAKTLHLDLPCSPCRQRVCPLNTLQCLRDITPQHVSVAIAELTAS